MMLDPSIPERTYTTRIGYRAILNYSCGWARDDFTYLGVLYPAQGEPIGWAWHHDGRSIDKEDRGFDLVDFQEVTNAAFANHCFWLGADGANAA